MVIRYRSFIIEKIGSRYCITPEWQRMSDEVVALTRTKHGAKRWINKNGTKWLEENWGSQYYTGAYSKNNRRD